MSTTSVNSRQRHLPEPDKDRLKRSSVGPHGTPITVGGQARGLIAHRGSESGSSGGDDDDEKDERDSSRDDVREEATEKYAEHVAQTLRCADCKRVLLVPVLQASCGERWHESCFKAFKLTENNSKCPVCNEILEGKVWRDVFAEKELGKLRIHCPAERSGCDWVGEKRCLQDHYTKCEFQQIECDNGCQETMLRKHLAHHMTVECPLRMVECSNCKVLIKYLETEDHSENCLQVPVECPNGCQPGNKMPRQELNDHMKQCKQRKEPCPILGCNDEVRYDKLHDHFDEHLVFHISSLNQGFTSTKKSAHGLNASLEEAVANVKQELSALENDVTLLLDRASGTEDQLAELSAYVKIKQQETLASCYQEVDCLQRDFKTKAESADQHINLITERLLNLEQIATMQAAKIRELETQSAAKNQATGMSQGTQQQFTAQDKVIATHDIQLAEHGLRIDMMDCKNTNGVLLWKITDISRRRRDAESGKTPSIYSQPFYTSPTGYKLCARLYLNGDGMGKGTHLSLFIVLMRGEYDTLLQWPFQQKVTLILVDQDGRRNIVDTFRPDPNSSSFKRPTSELNVATGCPLFVPLATLNSGGYIRDNSLFVKVVVDLTNASDPGMK